MSAAAEPCDGSGTHGARASAAHRPARGGGQSDGDARRHREHLVARRGPRGRRVGHGASTGTSTTTTTCSASRSSTAGRTSAEPLIGSAVGITDPFDACAPRAGLRAVRVSTIPGQYRVMFSNRMRPGDADRAIGLAAYQLLVDSVRARSSTRSATTATRTSSRPSCTRGARRGRPVVEPSRRVVAGRRRLIDSMVETIGPPLRPTIDAEPRPTGESSRTASGGSGLVAAEEPGDAQEAGVRHHAMVGTHGLAVDVPTAVEHLDRRVRRSTCPSAPHGPVPPA